MQEITDCWDKKASQWKDWVGENGDNNRKFHSDPVLWDFLGDVAGKKILDAGCGTGYFSVLLAKKMASVVGIDISPKMIEEANSALNENLDVTFKVDSAVDLKTIEDNSIDTIVSNYVLMDLEDLSGAIKNSYRVLKPNGKFVCVICHPCSGELSKEQDYFDEFKVTERWGPFDSDFIYFHRPLSQYWKTFIDAGFIVKNFDEPVAKDPSVPGFKDEWKKSYRKEAWSTAFLLQK